MRKREMYLLVSDNSTIKGWNDLIKKLISFDIYVGTEEAYKTKMPVPIVTVAVLPIAKNDLLKIVIPMHKARVEAGEEIMRFIAGYDFNTKIPALELHYKPDCLGVSIHP